MAQTQMVKCELVEEIEEVICGDLWICLLLIVTGKGRKPCR